MNALAKLLATAFGAGYSPIAPGTCGTIVAIPVAWALASVPRWEFVVVALVVTAVGIVVAAIADRAWGSHDNGRIVIDEVAGYLFTMIPVDRHAWTTLAIGFVLFRILDIVKPPPVRWLDEHLPGGWGVVLDDVAAGVIGAIVMALLAHFGVLARLAGI